MEENLYWTLMTYLDEFRHEQDTHVMSDQRKTARATGGESTRQLGWVLPSYASRMEAYNIPPSVTLTPPTP
jgi:hypothetical protein